MSVSVSFRSGRAVVWDVLVRRAGAGKFERESTHALRRLARGRMFDLLRDHGFPVGDVCVIRRVIRRETAQIILGGRP